MTKRDKEELHAFIVHARAQVVGALDYAGRVGAEATTMAAELRFAFGALESAKRLLATEKTGKPRKVKARTLRGLDE